jgi:YegS/Rv2252/BmrU family lipid kinase
MATQFMDVSRKHIALICNPTIEKAVRIGDAIALRLRQKEVRFSLFTTYWPTAWTDFTEAWIVGGDGTVNYFINQYPEFNLPFAVFAGGSGNDLHCLLYGSISLGAQIERVLQAAPRPVDAGMCNSQLFLNGIGIGFDGAVIRSMLGTIKWAGKASYFLAILRQLLGYQEKRCTLTYNDKKVIQDCFMICITNGVSFGGGFRVAPKASVTDELLDVLVVGKLHAVQRVRYLPVVQKGEHLHLPFVKYQHTKAIVVKSAGVIPAHCDGEYFSTDMFEIRCLEKRFSLLC